MKKIIITVPCPNCKKPVPISPGSLLGSIKSKKRSKAARENGKKGGRPKRSLAGKVGGVKIFDYEVKDFNPAGKVWNLAPAKLAINWDFQEAHSFLEALKNWGVKGSAWDCWLNDSNPRKSD